MEEKVNHSVLEQLQFWIQISGVVKLAILEKLLSVHFVAVPEVCYNDIYDMDANGTVSYQGRFFCPIDENMSEDYRYCCGEEGQQNCCTFWDK